MKKRFVLILAIVLFVLATASSSAPVSAKDTWTKVQSKNFLLIGNASEKEIKPVGVRLEQFREVFARLFPSSKVNSPVPTTVIVFKNEQSYRPFKPRENTAGYFQRARTSITSRCNWREIGKGSRIHSASSFMNTRTCSYKTRAATCRFGSTRG